jgi:two-component system, OmpR family, sensor kinase
MSDNESKNLKQEIDFLELTNKSLHKTLDEFAAFQEMLKGVAGEKTFDGILPRFVDIVKKYFPVKGFLFFQFKGDVMESVASENMTENVLSDVYGINMSILEWIIREKRISNVPPAAEDNGTALLIVPFFTSVRPYGIMTAVIESKVDEDLTLQISENLKLAASQASIAMENVMLYKDIAEQNLRLGDLKNFMYNILESFVNGVMTLDNEKRLTHINRNAYIMFGISEEEVIGKKYDECFPEQLISILDFIVKETYDKGFVLDYQVNYELIGGVTIPLGISTAILRNDTNDPIGTTIVSRDMTASQELERLRKIDKLKSDFVSTVSHELRSPLTTIKAYLDTLINRVDDNDKETRTMFLQTIEKEANRLSNLIEDMLNLSRIESGKIQLELEYIDITEIVTDVVNLCQMQSQQHTIHKEIPPKLPKVMADKDRLTQVFINIINNAIKYSPEGKNIWVRVFEEDNSLRVACKDEGMGLSEEDRYKIFEKFYRVNTQQTSNIGGTGLGLAIVKKLVEMHHGKIIVDSELNKGTTFTIVLPLKEG